MTTDDDIDPAAQRAMDRVPVPRWILLPPAPTGPTRPAWDAMAAAQQDVCVGLMRAGEVDESHEGVVTALLQRRVATAWRLRAAAVGLGWLVLMTVWGFGRAQTGVTVGPWLYAGVILAVAVASVQWRRVTRRLVAWRTRLAALDAPAAQCGAGSSSTNPPPGNWWRWPP